uniref:Protein lifeguard 2 n=1 Tax=Nothoprocta perdicaria TaxID=30464 RepID=A0A8C6YQH4_NOTPE
MTQGKLSVNAKPPSAEGQGEKKDAAAAPPAPPTYEEATAGEGMKAGAYPPPPSVPLHPSWAYVDPSESLQRERGLPLAGPWSRSITRSLFQVYAILMVQLLVTVVFPPAVIQILLCVLYVTCSYVSLRGVVLLGCVCSTVTAGLLPLGSGGHQTAPLVPCWPVLPLGSALVTRCPLPPQFDFTSYQGVLFVMLMVLFFGGIILAVILPYQYVPWLHVIYALLGAIIFTMFLAFDTQMLMGNRRYSLSPEEYIFGALNIYLDIIYIFSFFLQFFGSSQE